MKTGRTTLTFERSATFYSAFLVALAITLTPLIPIIIPVLGSRLEALPPSFFHATAFSLRQALASTAIAMLAGLPGAWLYATYNFPGRRILFAISAIPFTVPSLLVILAFVVYMGNSGFLSPILRTLRITGEGGSSLLYSFSGIIIVHAFYNFPIVIQIVGGAWIGIPGTRELAARSLGAKPLKAFMTGTLPSLIAPLLQAASLIFLFCYFSFTIVLVFGGRIGSTVEVEVYRALKIEANPGKALYLGMGEALVALMCLTLSSLAAGNTESGGKNSGAVRQLKKLSGFSLFGAVCYGIFMIFFLIGPLAALVWRAVVPVNGQTGGHSAILLLFGKNWQTLVSATKSSLLTALPAAFIATTIGTLCARARPGLKTFQRHMQNSTTSPAKKRTGHYVRVQSTGWKTHLLDATAGAPLAISSIISAYGWGLLLPKGGLLPIIFAQAGFSFPFVYRSMTGAFATIEKNPSLAARSLGATPFRAFMTVDLPAVIPNLSSSAAFAFAMAAGDASASLVLGTGNFQNLPLLLLRLVSSYRFGEACAAGLILALLSSVGFLFKEKQTNAA